jgi:hypothetical protein
VGTSGSQHQVSPAVIARGRVTCTDRFENGFTDRLTAPLHADEHAYPCSKRARRHVPSNHSVLMHMRYESRCLKTYRAVS